MSERFNLTAVTSSTTTTQSPDDVMESADDVITSVPSASSVAISVFVVSCSLAACGMALATVCMVFQIRYRHLRLIKMSSPYINCLMCVGALMAYGSCVMFPLEAFADDAEMAGQISCQGRYWMLVPGITFMFGAMVTKSWRVKKIFTRTSAKRIIIRDHVLMLAILTLLIIDLMVLGVLQSVDPASSSKYKEVYVYEDATLSHSTPWIRRCRSDYSIWIGVIYIYKAPLLLYAVYIGWTIKPIKLPSMNDSCGLLSSAVLVFMAGTLSAFVSMWWRHLPSADTICVVLIIWGCTTLVLCMAFIPKLRVWWSHSDEEMLKVSMTSQVLASNQDKDDLEVMHEMMVENETLESELLQKDSTILQLKQELLSMQNKLQLLSTDESKHDSGLDPDLSSSSVMELESSSHGHRQKQIGHDQRSEIHLPHTMLPRENNPSVVPVASSVVMSSSKVHGIRKSFKNIMKKIGLVSEQPKNGLEPNVPVPLTSEYEWRLSAYLAGSAEPNQTLNSIDSRHAAPPSISSRRSSYRSFNKRQSIAESIVDSFGFQNNEDNMSYISGLLSCSSYHMPQGYVNDGYSCQGDFDDDLESHTPCSRSKSMIRVRCSSCDSLSALPSDQFYPPALNHCDTVPAALDCEPRRRKKRRRSWKRSSVPQQAIYSLQLPQDPQVLATSGQAVTRPLGDERGYTRREVREDRKYTSSRTNKSALNNRTPPDNDTLHGVDAEQVICANVVDDHEAALAEEIIQHLEHHTCDTTEPGTFV